MEHSHRTFVHAGHVVTVSVEYLQLLADTIAHYSPDHVIRALASERLEQFGIIDVDCDEADPWWCAAVLFYYTGPLWACDF